MLQTQTLVTKEWKRKYLDFSLFQTLFSFLLRVLSQLNDFFQPKAHRSHWRSWIDIVSDTVSERRFPTTVRLSSEGQDELSSWSCPFYMTLTFELHSTWQHFRLARSRGVHGNNVPVYLGTDGEILLYKPDNVGIF